MGLGLEVLGESFKEQYQEAIKRGKIIKFDMTPERKKEIIELVFKDIKPEAPHTNYLTQLNGKSMVYQIILAETPENIQVYEQRYGQKVNLNWKGGRLGCFVTPEIIESLQPNTPYVLVGRLKIQTGVGKYEGRTFNNFSVQHIITMEEIAAYKKSK